MILVDTSVWIDHLRLNNEKLTNLLSHEQILAHPFIIGELALGNLNNRDAILSALLNLPQAQVAADAEVLGFIAKSSLYGIGIGYIDAHLLAAVRLTPGARLWTRDKRLQTASTRLGLAKIETH